MAHAYVSSHPDVLAAWKEMQGAEKKFAKVCEQVTKETGREIMVRRPGFGGDTEPCGLAFTAEEKKNRRDMKPPPGWKFGWGKRDNDFIQPRAEKTGPAVEARAVMERLRDACPRVRRMFHDRFGMPTYAQHGMHMITVGMELIDKKTLWLWYDDAEPRVSGGRDGVIWDGGAFFTPETKSAYYAAKGE